MKKIVLTIIALCVYCKDPTYQTDAKDVFFKGDHPLMALDQIVKTTETKTAKAGGGFFVCIGGFDYSNNSTKTQERVVNFSWKNNLQQYVISELPMSKVRFQLDSSITVPYCKFRWSTYGLGFTNGENSWAEMVIYVVFVLRPDQIYTKPIKLNLNY